MERSRYKIYEQQAPYFLSCTINNWIPIFTRLVTVQVILDPLAYRQEHHDLKIYAYVILENHLLIPVSRHYESLGYKRKIGEGIGSALSAVHLNAVNASVYKYVLPRSKHLSI
jgi:hypothetical protein